MIKSKLTAYIKTTHGWEKISRWKLLNMPQTEYKKFKDKYQPFYLGASKESPRLTFNIAQKTFRFLPGQFEETEKQSAGMTIAHLLAQEVLAELDTLNLCLRDKRTKENKKINIQIKVENAVKECYLLDGSFIADLVVYFSEPSEEAYHWDRKLVLEILSTHQVSGKKIAAFEENGIALVEIILGSKLLSLKKISEISEEEENQLKNYIRNSFKKQIYGDLLVSPTSSSKMINSVIESQREQIEKLEQALHQVNQLLVHGKEHYKTLKYHFDELNKKNAELGLLTVEQKNTISVLNTTIIKLEQEIERLNKLSFKERLKQVFKKSTH